MSQPAPADQESNRTSTGLDWILPVAALAFAVYYLISINELRWEAKVSGFLVAIILAVLIGTFAVKVAIGLAKRRMRLDFTGLTSTRDGAVRQAILLALIVAFIVAVQYAGFTISVFGFLLASFVLIARIALLRAAYISGTIALVGFVIFIVGLRASFPYGPVEALVMPLIRMIG